MFTRETSHRAPTLRRILISAAGALAPGLAAVALLSGFSSSMPLRVLEGAAVFATGAMLLSSVVILLMVRLAGWRQPEADFEALVQRSERLASSGTAFDGLLDELGDGAHEAGGVGEPAVAEASGGPFERAVRSALDGLPLEFHRALEHVAVVVSDDGWRYRAYGMYEGDTVAREHFHKRILIFRDTLMHDFGHNPELLQAQVERTLRHELAHHLGWDERGVRGLGL